MSALTTNDDIKMSNEATFEGVSGIGSFSGSSSSEDEGVIQSKEVKQLIKMENNISKTLIKIQSIRRKAQNNKLHENEETQFEILLIKVNTVINDASNHTNLKSDLKALKQENKQIRKLFQENKKVWQQQVKQEKQRLKQERFDKKQAKQLLKQEKKEFNATKKQEKDLLKQEKKLAKEKRKQEKMVFLQTLEKARIAILPDNLNNLELWIDGWNISGCFGGRSRSKTKLIGLLQSYYNNNKGGNNGLLKNIELFYDGNGKDKLDGNINVTHSGKDVIVDDLWIELLSKMNDNNRKANILCVTSDRELTVRLYNVGIKVMKSGTFFKTYLKPILENNDNSNNNNNDNSNDNDIVMVNNEVCSK